MAAGQLTIKGVTYSLNAESVSISKNRFTSEALDINGNLVVNSYGNTAKRRWQYSGKCSESICIALESALDDGTTGTFTDHKGVSYTACRFVFNYNGTGNYTNNCDWVLNVAEV